jgi:hypothetical protein
MNQNYYISTYFGFFQFSKSNIYSPSEVLFDIAFDFMRIENISFGFCVEFEADYL